MIEVLEDIGNLFSIEHAGAILGQQPPAGPQLRENTLSEGAWLPWSPTAEPWGRGPSPQILKSLTQGTPNALSR